VDAHHHHVFGFVAGRWVRENGGRIFFSVAKAEAPAKETAQEAPLPQEEVRVFHEQLASPKAVIRLRIERVESLIV
jgi:hypothetical protein